MFSGATGASDKPALHACRTCHKNNPNKGALVRHLHFNPLHKKAPTKEKPHQCDICSCIFSDQRSLATHIVGTHGDHGNLTVADCATANLSPIVGPETSADLLRENGAGDASSSTWEPAKGLTELPGVDAASAFRDEKTKCPSLTTKRWLEAMPYSHHQFKRWRLLLNAKERAKYKPKFKGTVRDRKVVARVWVKAKTTDPSLQCSRWAAEFGLDPRVVRYHAKPGSDVKRLHRLPAANLALVRQYHAAKAVDPMLTQEAWCKQNNVARLSFRKWLPAQAMKGLTQAAATWTGARSTRTPSYRRARFPLQEDDLFLAYTERHLGCQMYPREWFKAKRTTPKLAERKADWHPP